MIYQINSKIDFEIIKKIISEKQTLALSDEEFTKILAFLDFK